MGKKDDFWNALRGGPQEGPDISRSTYDAYRREQDKDLEYEPWKAWQRSLYDTKPFTPPTRVTPEFQQLPTALQPTVPSGIPSGQPAMGRPQVTNKALEQVMANLNSPTSGQTEVGKALRAQSSGEG